MQGGEAAGGQGHRPGDGRPPCLAVTRQALRLLPQAGARSRQP